jgi:hypothetical protein
MIKRIKSYLKILKIRVQENKLMSYEIFYLNQINNLLPKGVYLPVTSWSIAPTSIALILNEILIGKKENIIEFGAGLSTIYTCLLIAKYKLKVNFVSVDDNSDWINQQKMILKDLNCDDVVTFVHAPIAEITDNNIKYEGQEKWYDIKVLEPVLKKHSWDMVLIDGPQGWLTPFSRYSAIPVLKKYLNENIVVFLDDAKRPDESEIIERWSSILGMEVKFYNRLAIFKRKSVFTNQLFRV